MYPLKKSRGRGDSDPTSTDSRFDPFQPPQMVKELFIVDQSFGVENGVQRRFHLVLECKAVPSDLAVRIFQYPRIEAAQNIWRVVLSVGSAYRRFEVGCKVMPIKTDGGFR